jgi:hypothetical protein
VLLEPESKSNTLLDSYLINGVPAQIKDLIHQYGQIFQEPTTLSPSKQYDHSISLLPNYAPVNSRPYRYSAEQKNEIERQVAAMLKAGTIVPSLSPFASPVLLVKKKDNSWRFCVDYRKLITIIVNNKFPLPIIDEFLDEIAGAQYFLLLIWLLVFTKSEWFLQMRQRLHSKPIMGIFNLGLCHLD